MLTVRGLSTQTSPGNGSLVAQRPRCNVAVVVILLSKVPVQDI